VETVDKDGRGKGGRDGARREDPVKCPEQIIADPNGARPTSQTIMYLNVDQ